jgi:fatty-acyl-CoA synthase
VPGTGEELREFLLTRLAKYKIPRYVTFVDDLPKTGSGKIQKLRLRDLPGVTARAVRQRSR